MLESNPEALIILLVAFGASWLTLISGFGLGTLLLPVFVLFFSPLEAVAMTAVVHFLNNVFKFGLLWRLVDRFTILWFGLPAIGGALLGALLATRLTDALAYEVSDRPVGYFGAVVGGLMIAFAIQEIFPLGGGFRITGKRLIPGGLLSGFFGGLTGHQGALRTMFLLRSGLSAKAFIATGTAIALFVDITRIPVYVGRLSEANLSDRWVLLTGATLLAFLGAYIGKRTMAKVTFRLVQWIVALLMIGVGIALLLGYL